MGAALPPMPGYIWFHVDLRPARLETDEDAQSSWIQPGVLALVPHGEGPVLRSEASTPAPRILDLERELVSDRYESSGTATARRTSLIWGAVRFEPPRPRT